MDNRACAIALVTVFACAVYAAAQEIPPAPLTPAAAPQEASLPKDAPVSAAPVVSAPPAAAPSPAVPPLGTTIVKFKNGSVMRCRIVRETPQGIAVESMGVQFELARDEIEYYGDAAKCPGLSSGEVVADGKREAVDNFEPAVNIIAPAGAPAPTPRIPSREERFRAHQRKPIPGPSSASPPPAPPAPSSRISLSALDSDPSRYQGQRIVFPKVKLGVIQAHRGYCGLEILPVETPKGGKHRGGSSPELTPRGVTFVITGAQAEDLRAHAKQYDRARVEFTVEPRVVDGTRYWVAPVTRLDLFSGEGDEIAWTMW